MSRRDALAGQVSVVTGASRGIGAATSKALAAAGATVVLTSRSKDQLSAVADEIRSTGGLAAVVPGDLTDLGFVDMLFDDVSTQHGRLDILVNSAGTWQPTPATGLPPSTLRDMLDLNTVAPYACMRRAIELMRAGSDDGRIVNIGSTQAYWPAAEDSGPYPASKFALRVLTTVFARELKQAGSGIRMCMVNPGATNTLLVNPSGVPGPWFMDDSQVADAVMHAVTAPPGVHVFDTVVLAQAYNPW